MLKSKITRTPRPTVAYSADRKVTLAPLTCPLRASSAPPPSSCIGDGDVRIVCSGCHADILSIERE